MSSLTTNVLNMSQIYFDVCVCKVIKWEQFKLCDYFLNKKCANLENQENLERDFFSLCLRLYAGIWWFCADVAFFDFVGHLTTKGGLLFLQM